jgi:hypothetical protein
MLTPVGVNMKDRFDNESRKRVLLTGVFGPYGVDNDYGRKENIMELFHNQVTKGQGIASFRFHHRSFGLYFIACNIDADVTVLDFPSKKRFEEELRKGYDVVGISFITPNFVKAREMARLTRIVAPHASIVLGGHGAAVEGVEELIDCDHVVKGEGISWMRRFLGQDPNAPIEHPALASSERASIFGIPFVGPSANLLVPGLGCVNGCKFCSTSHFFGRKYTPFISTGKQLFETACRIADERGNNEFFVMDENFLKDRQRALDLLAEMEKHQRFFDFKIFSSAEAITAFGVDNLVRLGVNFVWIGVESSSQEGNYQKNKGIDAKRLIKELKSRGISVLASGILCLDHHTPDNIQEDIDFLVGLEADLVQFMLFTPLPVTALYLEHKRRGLLREDLPFEEWHGQKMLAWRHPHFPGDSAEKWLNAAFRKDFEENGSSIHRLVDTSFEGYLRLAAMDKRDSCLEHRMQHLARQTRIWSCILPTVAKHAVNEIERDKAIELQRKIEAVFPRTIVERFLTVVARLLAARWKLRVKVRGDMIQPATIVTQYRRSSPKSVALPQAASI